MPADLHPHFSWGSSSCVGQPEVAALQAAPPFGRGPSPRLGPGSPAGAVSCATPSLLLPRGRTLGRPWRRRAAQEPAQHGLGPLPPAPQLSPDVRHAPFPAPRGSWKATGSAAAGGGDAAAARGGVATRRSALAFAFAFHFSSSRASLERSSHGLPARPPRPPRRACFSSSSPSSSPLGRSRLADGAGRGAGRASVVPSPPRPWDAPPKPAPGRRLGPWGEGRAGGGRRGSRAAPPPSRSARPGGAAPTRENGPRAVLLDSQAGKEAPPGACPGISLRSPRFRRPQILKREEPQTTSLPFLGAAKALMPPPPVLSKGTPRMHPCTNPGRNPRGSWVRKATREKLNLRYMREVS